MNLILVIGSEAEHTLYFCELCVLTKQLFAKPSLITEGSLLITLHLF